MKAIAGILIEAKKLQEGGFIFSEAYHIELKSRKYEYSASSLLGLCILEVLLFLLLHYLLHNILIRKFTEITTLDQDLFISG